jgi:hypothetical protein
MVMTIFFSTIFEEFNSELTDFSVGTGKLKMKNKYGVIMSYQSSKSRKNVKHYAGLTKDSLNLILLLRTRSFSVFCMALSSTTPKKHSKKLMIQLDKMLNKLKNTFVCVYNLNWTENKMHFW